MLITRSLLIAPLVLLLATTAHAETRKREKTVSSGKMERLFVHSTYGSSCQGGAAPKIALKKKPQHGKVGTAESIEKVSRQGHKCDGKQIKGVGVFYQSAPGYKGTDRVVYRRGQGSDAFDMDVTITVK